MAATVAQRRTYREALLKQLYEATNGDTVRGRVRLTEMGANLPIADDELYLAASTLVNLGLAKWASMSRLMAITAEGVAAAEELIEPDTFSMGTTVLEPAERAELEAVIQPIRVAFDENQLGLEGDDMAEFASDLQTLEHQARSPRPKREIVRAALASVYGFVNRPIPAGVLSGGVVLAIDKLLRAIA